MRAGYGQASDLLGQGRGALTTNYAGALQPFQTNFNTAQGGQTAYANATGANGPVGSAAARANFQTDPGYQFRLQQGDENILRNAARTGSVNSGATNIDLQNFGQGQANQGWQQYIQNLQPFIGAAGGAASGIAGVSAGLGNQLAANFGQQGSAAYGTEAGIGNAQAQADLAKNAGVGNAINLGMNVAKLAPGIPSIPSFGGGGGYYGGSPETNSNLKPFADGGRPPVGSPSVVGERGPELFVPDRPGTVVPNESLSPIEAIARSLYDRSIRQWWRQPDRPRVGPFPSNPREGAGYAPPN